MKILMVCLGNICRSPLAHGIMQALVEQDELGWEVDSAGTGDWHVGQQPDRRSIRVAKENGVDISTQRAQWFTPRLFDEFDKIYVMDQQNEKDVLSQAVNEEQRRKVQLYVPESKVPDPYYDDTQFEPVYRMIYQRAIELLEELKQETTHEQHL